jgi:hypothetical protein
MVADELRKKIEPEVPVKTGNLKKSLKRDYNKKLSKKYASSRVGYKRPEGSHAHLLDRGTQKRWTKKGQYRGKGPALMFHTGTFENNKETLSRHLGDYLEKNIEDIWNNKKT